MPYENVQTRLPDSTISKPIKTEKPPSKKHTLLKLLFKTNTKHSAASTPLQCAPRRQAVEVFQVVNPGSNKACGVVSFVHS